MGGSDGQTVGADLVRGVTVRGDAVGTGDDAVDLARLIRCAAAESAITACGMPSCLELPGRQARALEQRPRLVDPDVFEKALLPGGAQRADRRAVPAGRQAAGVAVCQGFRARSEEG